MTEAPTTTAALTTVLATVASVAEYVALNKGGVGCCRVKDAEAVYVLKKHIKDLGKCKAACTADAACRAVELTKWRGCELHSLLPTHATRNGGCTCLAKSVTIAAAPATSKDAPTTAATATRAPATSAPAKETASDCRIQKGVDYQGHDLPGGMHAAVDDATACAELCVLNALCTHFTHAWGGCYLKSSDAGAIALDGGVSGACPGIATDPAVAAEPSYEALPGARGKCRTDTGKSTGVFVHHKNIKQLSECKELCTASAACKGIELSSYSGCELHTVTPTYTEPNGEYSCLLKSETAN